MAEMGERVATLETQMEDLTGNGQPGRVTKIEGKVDQLQEFMWRILGAVGALTALTALIEGLHFLRDMGVLPR